MLKNEDYIRWHMRILSLIEEIDLIINPSFWIMFLQFLLLKRWSTFTCCPLLTSDMTIWRVLLIKWSRNDEKPFASLALSRLNCLIFYSALPREEGAPASPLILRGGWEARGGPSQLSWSLNQRQHSCTTHVQWEAVSPCQPWPSAYLLIKIKYCCLKPLNIGVVW